MYTSLSALRAVELAMEEVSETSVGRLGNGGGGGGGTLARAVKRDSLILSV